METLKESNAIMSVFGIKDCIDLPDAVRKVLGKDRRKRDRIYSQLLEIHGYDLSYDWFQKLYEEELAQRKKNKQDFTPKEVCDIVSKIANGDGTVHEPTAGTGGLVIRNWWQTIHRKLPWEYFPSEHQVSCWELSDRAVPLLLLNLSIRGMMGYVYHGDVLENEVKQKYILLNSKDDALGFSDVIKVGNNAKIVKEV